MDHYQIALQQFMEDSGKARKTEDKCNLMKKRFKFKRTKEWYQLYLIFWDEKFDLGFKSELDVDDCDNAFAYTRILCRNLLNKMY